MASRRRRRRTVWLGESTAAGSVRAIPDGTDRSFYLLKMRNRTHSRRRSRAVSRPPARQRAAPVAAVPARVRGVDSSAPSTRSLRLGLYGGGSSGERLERRPCRATPMLSKSPGEIFDPVTRDADRLERLARRELELLRETPQELPRSSPPRRARRPRAPDELLRPPVRDRRGAAVRFDVVEEEAGEVGKLAERSDLLLHDRRRAARYAPRPSRSPRSRRYATSSSAYSSGARARGGSTPFSQSSFS